MDVLDYSNTDLTNIVTPVNVKLLEQLLIEHKYDRAKTKFLIEGFTEGFDLGYVGPRDRRSYSNNIPLNIGTPTEMWNKIMNEVHLGRYAGPFEQVPFDSFIQSPIGLVPKDGGTKTRLIFHLSYDFGKEESQKSLNYHTPDNVCTFRYKDLDHAIHNCLRMSTKNLVIYYSKTDLKSAFRIVPCKPDNFCLLVMQMKHPRTNVVHYFMDKCLPFGASRSCALFQAFSDALKYLFEEITGNHYHVTNYLDDYLFYHESPERCNLMVSQFIQLCSRLNVPVSEEKTELAADKMVLLGILLDGANRVLVVPEEKRTKALNILNWVISKRSLTIKQLQRLTGILNFLNRAVFAGRPFTRRMYSKFSNLRDKNGKPLSHYHHIRLDSEFKSDCQVWITFLKNCEKTLLCRPFIDIYGIDSANQTTFYSDASKNFRLGLGAYFRGEWVFA